MAYALAVRIAAHQAVLDYLSAGASGTAVLNLLAGATLLASLPIDHAASSVSQSTDVLSLVPAAGGATVAQSGSANLAQLVARDGSLVEDALAVEAGLNPVPGKVILSSLNLIAGAHVDLISCAIG